MSDAPAPVAAGGPAARGFRSFLVLWSTQTLSLFGTFVSMFAINVWLVRDLYPSPGQKAALALALTATTVATTAPLIFAMPLAGAFADRHDRRRVLIAANLCAATITGVIVSLLLAHALTLPFAVLLLVGYSICGAFHSASFESSYALLVEPRHLPRANGMMMTSYGLSQLLSPAVAATLVGLPVFLGNRGWSLPGWAESGIAFAFVADGSTFLVAAAAVAALHIPMPIRPADAPATSLLADMREGFAWIARHRPLRWLIANGTLANFTLAPLSLLLPVLVRDRLAGDMERHHLSFEATLALVNTTGGLGMVAGGLVVSVWGMRAKRRTLVIVASLAVLGVGEVLTGLSTTVWTMAAAMLFTELLVGPLNTASYTLWQSLTPPHMLARALSVRRFMAQGSFPVGTAIAGWVAAVMEPWLVLVLSGAALTLWCAAQLFHPQFATLEERMRESVAAG